VSWTQGLTTPRREVEFSAVSFCVVGVGGWGRTHVRAVETLEKEGLGRLSAVVIRNREKYREAVARFESRNVRIYGDYEAMLEAEKGRIDIVTLPTPIHLHKEMAVKTLRRGFNVIIEKPPAATIQDMDEMIEAEKVSGKFCSVGFQSQSKNTVQALKRRICEGKLGEIREVAVKGKWKRLDSYYERSPWAGKFLFQGRYVLDGTINNPLAHQLMNGLYFASREEGKIATPLQVKAELYSGHEIEGEDTSCLVAEVEGEARIHFYATLCAPSKEDPSIEVVGTEGKADWTLHGDTHLEYSDGKKEVIRDDGLDEQVEVFRNAARYLRREELRLNCPLAMTRSFVLTVNGAFESAGRIRSIPKRFLTVEKEGDSISTTIKGIVETIDQAFQQRKLYSELGVEWAHPTKHFSVVNYSSFSLKPYGC